MCLSRTVLLSLAVSLPLLFAQDPDTDAAARQRQSNPTTPSRVPNTRGSLLPTGARLTPMAMPGSTYTQLLPGLPGLTNYVAGQPMTTVVSPDGKTLAVLTSGYNLLNGPDGNNITNAGGEYIFLFDISADRLTQKQVHVVPTAFGGIAWNPSGTEFYVGAAALDSVYIYTATNGVFAASGTVALAHQTNAGLGTGLGLGEAAIVAGVAVNARGDRLLAANYYNDSVSFIDIPNRRVLAELDLRPGVTDPTKTGVAGGEYPFWVTVKGNDKAYVSSVRDREIVVVNLANDKPMVASRIPVSGNPNKMLLNAAQSRLFAAVDNADAVYVVDTNADTVLGTIPTTAPAGNFVGTASFLKGSNPNSLALSPDERTLYVTNGGTNSVAVIALGAGGGLGRTTGLIPTAWYPDAVSVSSDGTTLFVANTKNIPGPNPGACTNTLGVPNDAACNANNQYVWQLEKGGMMTIPVPAAAVLDRMTAQVESNNNFNQAANHEANASVMAQVRAKIQHVI